MYFGGNDFLVGFLVPIIVLVLIGVGIGWLLFA